MLSFPECHAKEQGIPAAQERHGAEGQEQGKTGIQTLLLNMRQSHKQNVAEIKHINWLNLGTSIGLLYFSVA